MGFEVFTSEIADGLRWFKKCRNVFQSPCSRKKRFVNLQVPANSKIHLK